MRKITVKFSGGKRDGKLATVLFAKFSVGCRFKVGDEFYKVQDGPIARTLESGGGSESEHLAIVAVSDTT